MISLLVKDQATFFGLKITVQRSFKGVDVETFLDTMVAQNGTPKYIRFNNGRKFIAHVVQRWARMRSIILA